MKIQKHGPHKQAPENYRWLAAKCREAARKVSTEKERDDLLAKAETFDLLSCHRLRLGFWAEGSAAFRPKSAENLLPDFCLFSVRWDLTPPVEEAGGSRSLCPSYGTRIRDWVRSPQR
jgi:hypothetical protein